MTVAEIRTEFKVYLDEVATGAVPAFDNARIDIFINNAIETER